MNLALLSNSSAAEDMQRHQQRIFGPLMDRIYIHLEVMRVPFEKLIGVDGGKPTWARLRCAVSGR